jgi:hypothetical protein
MVGVRGRVGRRIATLVSKQAIAHMLQNMKNDFDDLNVSYKTGDK